MGRALEAEYLLTAEVGHPFIDIVRRVIEQHHLRAVCDVGGGANPVLPRADIERFGLSYLVVDASARELRKTPPEYDTLHHDVVAAGADLGAGRFDLVLSKFVAEHIADPARFHAVIRRALRPGGFAAHFFPTLPSPPFVVNRLLGGRESGRLVDVLQPRVRDPAGPLGKFPAYYRWCVGPTRRQQQRLAAAGYEIVDYVVLVGHRYYARFPVAQRAADAVSRRLVGLRRPFLATYACVVLRRPP